MRIDFEKNAVEIASVQSPLKYSVAYFGYLQHLYGLNVAYDDCIL